MLPVETAAKLKFAQNFIEIWAEIIEMNEENSGRVQKIFLDLAHGKPQVMRIRSAYLTVRSSVVPPVTFRFSRSETLE